MRTWLLTTALTLVAMQGKADEVVDRVGDYGGPQKVVVHGATTFSEAEIVKELFDDLDIANAAYPTAPLNEFQRLLADKTRAGYQVLGFAEASVKAYLDEALGKVVLKVVEGPLYMAGDIEISGLPDADANWLRDELVGVNLDGGIWSKARQPGWCSGKPAGCDPEMPARVHRIIERRLLERGVLFAKFTVDTRLDRDRRTAALQIAFSDPGQLATLGEIIVWGNEANSTEDILAYLGLTPGIAVTGNLQSVVADRLAKSGRFVKSDVKVITPTRRGEKLVLDIDLVEYKKAPLLREPLSKEEEALIKFSQWLAGFDKSNEEILITLEHPALIGELLAAPRSGLVLMIRETAESTEKRLKPLTSLLCFACDEIVEWLPKNDRQYVKPFRRLLELGALQPVERFLATTRLADDSGFSLPVRTEWRSTLDAIPYFCNFWLDSIVPHGCWVERLAREACFAAAGKSRHLDEELARQESEPRTGPLRYLCMAATARLAGMRYAALRYAQEGKRRELAPQISGDLEFLLDPNYAAGACFTSVIDALGHLSRQEVDVLCRALVHGGVINEAHREELATCIATLRNAAEPHDHKSREFLDVVWDVGLRDRILSALCQIAGPPAATVGNNSRTYRGTVVVEKDATNAKTQDDSVFTPLSPFGPERKRSAKGPPRYVR